MENRAPYIANGKSTVKICPLHKSSEQEIECFAGCAWYIDSKGDCAINVIAKSIVSK